MSYENYPNEHINLLKTQLNETRIKLSNIEYDINELSDERIVLERKCDDISNKIFRLQESVNI